MTRALGILAAIAALAFSAAPAAAAASSAKPPPRGIHTAGGWDPFGLRAVSLTQGTGSVVHGALKGGRKGIVTDNKDPDKLGVAHARGTGVIENLGVKYSQV